MAQPGTAQIIAERKPGTQEIPASLFPQGYPSSNLGVGALLLKNNKSNNIFK